VVHWEIQARDPERMRGFYAQLFNWRIGDGPIHAVSPGFGGPEPGPGGHIRASQASRISLYIQVRSLADSLEKATDLGATVTLEPVDVPGGPTIAGIEDPEGNPLVLVQQ
jgi:predicted enzyme related to lactoylglutathione lyase